MASTASTVPPAPASGMLELIEHIDAFEKNANLSASITDVENAIDLLCAARSRIASDPHTAPLVLAKLQEPLKTSLHAAQADIKPIYAGLNKYGRALDKKFQGKPLPSPSNDALSSRPELINRAIAMHLLRQGEFDVFSTFLEEAQRREPNATVNSSTSELQKLAGGKFHSDKLQRHFMEMYHILHELRQGRNLAPAIEWARERSHLLESRGSNLEFELCRLQFVCLFVGGCGGTDEDIMTDGVQRGPLEAWAYARRAFGSFQERYAREVQQLMGAMAYWQNVEDSPYRKFFRNESAWEEVAASFMREFCALIGLSADSPLYIAATAGAIALPHLLKLQSIMEKTRTEWTTQHELPVEIPLPPAYNFHSIFVCPVSKEQSTDQNPPMMMPCGHVIAQESLDRLSKGVKFKCPYCPGESHPRDAKKIFL